LLLNNDTEVKPDFLDSLVELMESDKNRNSELKILYFEDNTIQYAGASPINPITSRGRHYGYKRNRSWTIDETETSYPHGACMMIRKVF
jgi:GT2 family glycosyltransferase